jgi:preprotein translocase subunit SecG
MYQALLTLLILDCFALVIVVLLQAGKGGGLAAGFGGAGTGIEMMGSRQTASFLHNATKWLGGAFLVIAFLLSVMTVRATGPRSLIESEMRDQPPPGAQPGPASGTPSDLENVLGGQPAGGTTPADGGQDQAPPDQPGGTPPRQ